MPLELTRNELAKLMEGSSIGVTRYYGGDCPHAVGEPMLLCFGKGDDGRPAIVAKATLVSVRPFRVKDRRANTPEAREEAQKEGWATPAEWWGHFERLYNAIDEDEVLHRLQLRIENRVESVQDTGHPLPMLQNK
jgi:hypothetical protein